MDPVSIGAIAIATISLAIHIVKLIKKKIMKSNCIISDSETEQLKNQVKIIEELTNHLKNQIKDSDSMNLPN